LLVLYTLTGWEQYAYLTFGVAALICLGLVLWPVRLGAAVLFWPFAAAACLYAGLLIGDVWRLSTGGSPSVLLNAVDSVVFILVELVLIAIAVLVLYMWSPERLGPRIRARRIRTRSCVNTSILINESA
jgi:hypothetical protein